MATIEGAHFPIQNPAYTQAIADLEQNPSQEDFPAQWFEAHSPEIAFFLQKHAEDDNEIGFAAKLLTR